MIADSQTDEALHDYICRHPAEDDVRLAYADVLEERGEDERAEFIRVGVELAAWERRNNEPLPAGKAAMSVMRQYAAKIKDLRRREENLLERFGGDWLPLPWDSWDVSSEPGARLTFSTRGGPSAVVTFRRGFPADITLTAEAFAGGLCSGCRGTGDETSDGQGTCGDCHGTGRTPGHAAALFRAAPIEAVELSDKRPEYHLSGNGGMADRWSWFCAGLADDPATLPRELFSLLEGGASGMDGQRWVYSTESAAHDALAAAALLLGRRRGWPCPRCRGDGVAHHLAGVPIRCEDCHGLGHTVETPA